MKSRRLPLAFAFAPFLLGATLLSTVAASPAQAHAYISRTLLCRTPSSCAGPATPAAKALQAEVYRGRGALNSQAGNNVRSLRTALWERPLYLANNTSTTSLGLTWTELGPTNIGGRVNAILINASNTQQLLAGTAGGGLWTSSNGGSSWTSVSDSLGSLAISTLAGSFSGTLYAGTGDLFDPSRGVGILESTDGGTTWTALSATDPSSNKDWYYVNHIAISSSGVMLVATGVPGSTWGAIYRSTDGGQTFTKVQAGPSLDVVFDPNNANDAVAEFENGTVRYSADGGQTWSSPVTVASGAGRITLAFASDAGNAGWVYASVDNSPGSAPSGQIYLSKDDGQTWTLQSSPGQLCSGSECQGWYDNILWVDPTNALHLVTGGINLFQSTDGGSNWTQISDWRYTPTSPHADQHAIASAPGNASQVYVGNDGGVYGASNISTVTTTSGWTELNNGLAVTQFYSAAGHVGDTASANNNIVPIIGGAQDNGTEVRDAGASGTSWTEFFGGDGGYTDVDPGNANYLYGEYVYLDLFQSTDGGSSASQFSNEPPDSNSSSKANFIAPFMLDPTNSNAMFAGGQQLWYGTSLQSTATWRSLSGSTLPQNSGDFINAIGVDPSNDNNVWVGFDGGGIYHSTDATASTPTWTQVSTGAGSAEPTSIYLVPGSPNTVYVTYWTWSSGNIYETTDGGSTWKQVGQALPPVPVNDITTDPRNNQIVYAASEIGLFVSQDGGQTWTTSNQGPANVSVTKLRWFDPKTPKLLASTYGRGAWLARPDNLLPILNSTSPSTASSGSSGVTLTARGKQFATKATIDWNGTALTTTYVSDTQLTATVPSSDLTSAGSVNVTVVNPAPGGGTSSAATFTITNPAPTLSGISPANAVAGSGATTITLNGTDFLSSSIVEWNGTALTTSYVSNTQLSATVPAADLTAAGTFNVTVVNPAPGGGTSGATTFTVTSQSGSGGGGSGGGGSGGGGSFAAFCLAALGMLWLLRRKHATVKENDC